MNEFFTVINEVFTASGFTVMHEISATVMFRNGGDSFAVPKFKKAEVSKRVTGTGTYTGHEIRVTAAVRCIGQNCKYSDAEELEMKVARARRRLAFNRSENVRWLSTGEVVRDRELGRLTVTVMLEMVIYEDRENEPDEEV